MSLQSSYVPAPFLVRLLYHSGRETETAFQDKTGALALFAAGSHDVTVRRAEIYQLHDAKIGFYKCMIRKSSAP